ncbi:hypothetical protein SAMN05660297_02293 [Natronincola peptidivorans]|uniref:Amidohydrolase-related domain-containing protein n=1 Tax=Natronincola peptidivorans TaxID=426128 RepID=A0A1I0E5V2_9FIRM|nr:amidohydrolase family protein [Natronincola peptidivorans]SET40535.1 hypothetical protein SAMN05660297_02293 [Natronincola peptidivorans]
MEYLIIDAHAHLWEELKGSVAGKKVQSLGGGKAHFMGETKQMMPPYMVDGKNSVETLISNMDYARVAAAVITQEYIDGNQNQYVLESKQKFLGRLFVCGLAEVRKEGFITEIENMIEQGFDGIKIPAQWLTSLPERVFLTNKEMMSSFKLMEENNVILSIDLAPGDEQVPEMKEVIQEHPNLKIAIGHFGMANRPHWKKQIKLAENKNVRIESGGITWLFHNEFYPYPGAIKAIKEAIDLVGVDKLMWGSDYPRTMTAITYTMSHDFVLKTKELTLYEKKQFLGENAREFYGFTNLRPLEYVKNMVED